MKRTIALVFVTAMLAACAVTHAADVPPPSHDSAARHSQPEAEDATYENTRSVIVLNVDGGPEGFIFVSKTGATLAWKAADCAKEKSCVALLMALHKAHKVNTITLQMPKGAGLPEKQPDTSL